MCEVVKDPAGSWVIRKGNAVHATAFRNLRQAIASCERMNAGLVRFVQRSK